MRPFMITYFWWLQFGHLGYMYLFTLKFPLEVVVCHHVCFDKGMCHFLSLNNQITFTWSQNRHDTILNFRFITLCPPQGKVKAFIKVVDIYCRAVQWYVLQSAGYVWTKCMTWHYYNEYLCWYLIIIVIVSTTITHISVSSLGQVLICHH